MRRTVTRRARWALVSGLLIATTVRQGGAVYLDEAQNVSLRARIYSEASIRLENSQQDTIPNAKTGQLVAHRNFYNPELEAKLLPFLGSWATSFADDLSFRVAGWGFYDGVYDYGSGQFNDQARKVNATFGQFSSNTQNSAWFIEGPTFNVDALRGTGAVKNADTFDDVFPGYEVQNPRDIYGHRQRVNELYLNYAKGPFFLRLGRQAISWGEADTIALLDQNNPFDVTLGAPGVFQDLDEARIPLWTVRSSMNLFDTLGPLSSGFIEAYLVPGDLDTETGILPILTASPYSVRGDDPNKNPTLVQACTGLRLCPQFVLFDRRPSKDFNHSRWGVRLQTVVNGSVTLQAWHYTHFPNAPVPLKRPPVRLGASQNRAQLFIIETQHKLTHVTGVAASGFAEWIDTIVRGELEYFYNEPSFTPEGNLSIGPGKDLLNGVGELEHADYIRGELGFDRFFFLRALNPANSFLGLVAFVGSFNLDETPQRDFRMNGQQKPGTGGQDPDDFVQQKAFEGFMQAHLQTDYMHGRLTPQITYIQNLRGTYALQPKLTYRFYDWLLFDLNLVHIGGEFQQLGFFRDRDQLNTRVTFQLN